MAEISFGFTADELGNLLMASGMKRPDVAEAVGKLGDVARCVDVTLGSQFTTVCIRAAAQCMKHENCRALAARERQAALESRGWNSTGGEA